MNSNNESTERRIPRRRRSSYSKAEIKQGARESFYTLVNNGYFKLAIAMIFFSLSIVYYKKSEQWNAVDCVLFVIVSASTVGYGNIHPTTDTSRVYTIFLMVFGAFVVYAGLIAYLNSGIIRMNIFLAKSVTSRLKRTEVLFQRRLVLSILWVFACSIIGALILQSLENLTFITALYFSVQTMMTVGYGDISFNHQSTKIFLIFFIVLSTTLLSLAINNIYALIQNRKVLNERRSLLKLQRKLHFLADLNDGRGLDRFEFVLTILQHIGTLDHDKDIAPWLKKFRALDTYDSGILNQQQLALFSEQHARECETEIEEIEQIALSTSNVESLPVASPSLSGPLALLNDFRQRAMTVGLFSDQVLYAAEHFDEADNDNTSIPSDDGYSDFEDPNSDPEGGKPGYQRTPSGNFQRFFRSRPRASTTRKFSTAGQHSDEDDEMEGENDALSPMSLELNTISAGMGSPTAAPLSVTEGSYNRPVAHRQSSGRRSRERHSTTSPPTSPPVLQSACRINDVTNSPFHPHTSLEPPSVQSGQKPPHALLPHTPPVVVRSPHMSPASTPLSAPSSPHASRSSTQRAAGHAYHSSEDDSDLDTHQEEEFTYNALLSANMDSGSAGSAGGAGIPTPWLTPSSCAAPSRQVTRPTPVVHEPCGAAGLPPRHPPLSTYSHIVSGGLHTTPERAERGGPSDLDTPDKIDRERAGTGVLARDPAAVVSFSNIDSSNVRPWHHSTEHTSRSPSASRAAAEAIEEQGGTAEETDDIASVDDTNIL